MLTYPRYVKICEVAGRDGFQSEKDFIRTEDKTRIIDSLAETGVWKIEATSFVHPKAVPQLRDAEEVMAGIKRRAGVIYTCLVPNIRGAQRALGCSVDELNVVISASGTHNMKNVGMPVEKSLENLKEIVSLALNERVPVNGSVGTAFGCPFEGVISKDRTLGMVDRYLDMGVNSITLADTTGMANPSQVYELLTEFKARWPKVPVALHFHNTRGMGLANVLAGMQAGVDIYDASLGGLGGCPFAPGATGNICTEDLVHMLHEMGIVTGIDLDMLIEVSRGLEAVVGRILPGLVIKAGRTSCLHALYGG